MPPAPKHRYFAQESVIVDCTAVPGSPIGESTARFDILLRVTPMA